MMIGKSSENMLRNIEGLNKIEVKGLAIGSRHCLIWDKYNKLYSFGDSSYG